MGVNQDKTLIPVHKSKAGEVPVTDALAENLHQPLTTSLDDFINYPRKRDPSDNSNSSATIKGRRLSPNLDAGFETGV